MESNAPWRCASDDGREQRGEYLPDLFFVTYDQDSSESHHDHLRTPLIRRLKKESWAWCLRER